MNQEKRQLPKKSQDLSGWYNRVVQLAQLADYGPARGTMIFRPYGYGIWENIQKAMDWEIRAAGVENAYFPMFIPESFLKREKEHVEGFSPELAVVTIGGGEELKEKLIVRPTSETIMYDAYSKWIQSWRDLPVEINQWNNIVRWEKRTYLFLRTLEFLWQEGHSAHATHEESLARVKWAIDMYAGIYRNWCALPGVIGRKSDSEKFAGAVATWTYEMLMPEGKILQASTSHDLGQNFAKPFNVRFQDKDGKTKYVWQNSWGFSSRSIGALLLAHGDDAGIILPPKLAPIQIIVLPVTFDADVLEHCFKVVTGLVEDGFRVKVDDRDDETIGYRINKWELKGVPIRLEIGKKEMQSGQWTAARRDTGEKVTAKSAKEIEKILADIQSNLLTRQEKFLRENTHEVDSYDRFKEIMEGERGFIRAFWCEDAGCEAKIKEETKATVRCLPGETGSSENPGPGGKCIRCGKAASHQWLFGISY
jgi:prolyl-tRNA synthetase